MYESSSIAVDPPPWSECDAGSHAVGFNSGCTTNLAIEKQLDRLSIIEHASESFTVDLCLRRPGHRAVGGMHSAGLILEQHTLMHMRDLPALDYDFTLIKHDFTKKLAVWASLLLAAWEANSATCRSGWIRNIPMIKH